MVQKERDVDAVFGLSGDGGPWFHAIEAKSPREAHAVSPARAHPRPQ